MGAEFWECYAPFNQDVAATFSEIRERELVLDVDRIASSPDMGAASPIPRDRLIAIFMTDHPTRKMVEEALQGVGNKTMDEVIEEIERGEGRYILLYEGDRPTEVYFFGYSLD